MKKLTMMVLALTAGLSFGGCDDDEDELIVDGRVAAIDTDDNALIDADEWNVAFNTWDIDDDELIDDGEFQFNGDGFEQLDVDGDGFVDPLEWNAGIDTWDDDDDLFLDEDELDPFL